MLLQAAYRKLQGQPYDIEPHQAKAALVRAGPEALEYCARHLVLGDADPDVRARNWREFSKPLLQFVWPGDAEARTDDATERLVWLTLAAVVEAQSR